MKKLILVVAILGGIGFASVYFSDDHQRYLAFDKERDAWHRKCDVYRGAKNTSPAAQECAEELQRLMAYAKRQGW